MSDLLYRHLVREEGLRLEPYKDHKGFWTIGVGHLIDRRRGGSLPEWIRAFPISPNDAEQLLQEDVDDIEGRLYSYEPWIRELTEVRRVVLVSMAFQMGVDGLLLFVNTLAAVKSGEWDRAARGMLASKWAREDTPERAARMAKAMRTGLVEGLEL